MDVGTHLREQPLSREKLQKLKQEMVIVRKCGSSLVRAADAEDSNEEYESSTLTSKIIYEKLRELLGSSKVTTPSTPWSVLKDTLLRQPIVFIAAATASTGDRYPYFRVILVSISFVRPPSIWFR